MKELHNQEVVSALTKSEILTRETMTLMAFCGEKCKDLQSKICLNTTVIHCDFCFWGFMGWLDNDYSALDINSKPGTWMNMLQHVVCSRTIISTYLQCPLGVSCYACQRRLVPSKKAKIKGRMRPLLSLASIVTSDLCSAWHPPAEDSKTMSSRGDNIGRSSEFWPVVSHHTCMRSQMHITDSW